MMMQFESNIIRVISEVGGTSISNTAKAIEQGESGHIPEATKVLFTVRKKPFNSDDGFGQVEFYNNKTSIGTSNGYNVNISQAFARLGDDNTFTGFKGHMYELGIYNRALSDTEISDLQDYFINRTNISV